MFSSAAVHFSFLRQGLSWNLELADLARLAGGMCPGVLLSFLPALRVGDRHTAPSHLYSKHFF